LRVTRAASPDRARVLLLAHSIARYGWFRWRLRFVVASGRLIALAFAWGLRVGGGCFALGSSV
jgi:hypothetical protein